MPKIDGEDDDREDDRERANQDDPGDGDDPEGQDGGGGDDEVDDPAELAGDDSDDGEHVDDPDDEPRRKPSRRDQRIQRLADDRAQERERSNQLEREVAELRGRVAATQQETPEQEAARISLMSPDERSEYRLEKATRQNRQDMANLEWRLSETADKSAFEAKASINPVYRRHAAEVETRLQALRAQGQNVGREHLLRYIVGEKAMERASKDGNRHERRGKEAIERERVKPSNGRGDVQNRRGKEADTPRKRLENVII